MDSGVAIPHASVRNFVHAPSQCGLWIFHALVLPRAACLFEQCTGPAQLQAVVTSDILHYVSLQRGPPHFLMRRPSK
jgi:hypothetical protein